MFDRVEVEIEDFDVEPDREWQTKHRRIPMMETFRIDEEGLWLEEVESEEVPEEEQNEYGVPLMRRNRVGWDHWDDFHGMFEFHGNVDGEYRSYEAKFTDGELEGIGERFWDRREQR